MENWYRDFQSILTEDRANVSTFIVFYKMDSEKGHDTIKDELVSFIQEMVYEHFSPPLTDSSIVLCSYPEYITSFMDEGKFVKQFFVKSSFDLTQLDGVNLKVYRT